MVPDRIVVDLAVLAHQEEKTIGAAIGDLARQDILRDPRIDIRVWLLANGCRDRTAEAAREAVARLDPGDAARFTVLDLPKPGKSRTVGVFIHTISRPEAQMFVFLDADCRLIETDTIARMVDAVATRPELQVFTGRPVKDIIYTASKLGFVERLIAAGAEQLSDFRKSIAGGLYCIRADVARRIHLPVGLPVEDGFVRAMVLTDFLSEPEHFERIDGDPGVFFIYESIRTIPALVKHQTRIVVGSAINTTLYGRIRRLAPTSGQAQAMLREAAQDDGWLARVLKEELPRAPFGYVPFHFLVKRLTRFDPALLRHPQRFAAFLGGLGLDAVAYVLATLRMMSGRAAGHW
jgi:glycosyltransferase involved in cell wall biosynthesis